MMLLGRITHLALQAPKKHAKSTIFSKVVALHLMCVVDPNVRIIGGSVNSDLAEQFLLANRKELERNELLIDDFGPFRPERTDGEKWTQQRFIIRRTSTSQSPTYRAVGTEKPVQGGRADWVIGDDLIDLENARTKYMRDKVDEWIDGDLMGTLEPGGHALLVGTAKHVDDALARREKKAKEPSSGWFFKRYDAIIDEKKKISLWPARWPYDALMQTKVDVGSLTFNRDYRNRAVDETTALFKREWFNRRAPLPKSLVALIQSIDAAWETGVSNSYSVIQTWGFDGLQFRLLDVWRDKVEYPDLKRIVGEAIAHYGPQAVLVENKASGTAIIQELGAHTAWPIISIQPHGSKYSRAESVTALFEASRVVLPDNAPWIEDYVEEMAAFPNGEFNDQVDATSQALTYLSERSMKHKPFAVRGG